MSKRNNIEWTENDLQEIKRAVKNFNAKVKRVELKYQGTNTITPEKVSLKDLKKLITTNRDLQRELKSLQSFTQRGAETPVKLPNSDDNRMITQWQKSDMEERAKIINRVRAKRKKELEKTEVKRNQKGLGYTQGAVGMGSLDSNMYEPTNPFPKNLTQRGSEMKMEHLRKESYDDYWRWRENLLRENFTDQIEKNFGKSKKMNDIVKYMRGLSPRGFYKKYKEHPSDFDNAYPKSKSDMEAFALELAQNWLPPSKLAKWKKKHGIND